MLSYNQIITISRAFQQSHHVLKNFGNGPEADMVLHNQQATYKYPLMWMIDVPSGFQEGIESFNFRVVFMAPVVTLKDRGTDLMSTNVNEVKSDMIQCANNFIAYWVQQTDNYDTLGLERSINRETFEDYTDDKLTGCSIDIRFYQPFEYDECGIPMGTPSLLPDTCAPVILKLDLVQVDTIASGDVYNITVIDQDGGTPTYTYDQPTKTLEVQVGGDCDPVEVSVNSDPFESVPSGGTLNVPILDTASNPVGTNTGPSVEIADSVVTLNGTGLTPMRSEQNKTISLIDAINSDPVSATIATDTESLAEVVIPNTSVSFQGSPVSPTKSGGSKAVTVKYANGTNVGTATTDTNAALHIEIPNPTTYPIAYVRESNIMDKTSYLTYDLKWFKDNTNYFDDTNVGIKPVLDTANHLLLLTLNAFGNFNRRTNDLGGSVSDGSDGSTANYMIDNYTGDGYYMLDAVGNNTNWNDSAAAIYVAAFAGYSGWRMPTYNDINLICFGDGANENIFTGINSWGSQLIYIMCSSSATAVYFWRRDQIFTGSIRLNAFNPATVSANIRSIAVRKHF